MRPPAHPCVVALRFDVVALRLDLDSLRFDMVSLPFDMLLLRSTWFCHRSNPAIGAERIRRYALEQRPGKTGHFFRFFFLARPSDRVALVDLASPGIRGRPCAGLALQA